MSQDFSMWGTGLSPCGADAPRVGTRRLDARRPSRALPRGPSPPAGTASQVGVDCRLERLRRELRREERRPAEELCALLRGARLLRATGVLHQLGDRVREGG